MPRPRASMPPDAIRIEDEVWKEAFARREPSPARAARRLRALDGGLAAPAPARPASTATAAPARPAASGAHAPTRLTGPRTVVIRGRGAERELPWPDDATRRRTPRRAYERTGFRPDRVAMWAVLLGMLLVLVAIASGHS